jgi:hypothetical protein
VLLNISVYFIVLLYQKYVIGSVAEAILKNVSMVKSSARVLYELVVAKQSCTELDPAQIIEAQ